MSGCYCEYGSATDFPDFFAQKTVKARKPHQCCECLEPIAVGEMYERCSGLWNGRFEAYTTCAHCATLRKEALDETDGELPFGQLACWYATKVLWADEIARAGEAP